MNLIRQILKIWISKKTEIDKNYCHFLFVHKNDATCVTFKKTGTATLIFTVQVHNLAQTNIQKCSKNMV